MWTADKGASSHGTHPRGAPRSQNTGCASSKTSSFALDTPNQSLMKILAPVIYSGNWRPRLIFPEGDNHTIPQSHVSWPEAHYILFARSDSELFPGEKNPSELYLLHMAGNSQEVFNQKRKERTLFWPVLTEHPHLSLLNKTYEEFGSKCWNKVWCPELAILQSQPKVPWGRQEPKCQFPLSAILNCPADVDEKQNHAA